MFELALRGYIKVCEAEDRGQHSGRKRNDITCPFMGIVSSVTWGKKEMS